VRFSEGMDTDRVTKAKKVFVVNKAPETAKEGKVLQLKLGSKSRKTRMTKLSAKMSHKGLSSTIDKMETVDEDEATYDTAAHYVVEEENVKLSCCRKVFGNCLCPLCGVTRWRKQQKVAYADPKSKIICAHVLSRFNSMYYYFANQLGPDVKFFAEELFFKKGQIETDGLCAITAQIWTVTYLLQFEVSTMKEIDWNDMRTCFLNLVWITHKFAVENQKFYDIHQEFLKSVYEHLDKLDKIVGNNSRSLSELDPPLDTKTKRLLDGLFINEGFLLKNKLILSVSSPHEETRKFDDFPEAYRIKTMKYFLQVAPMTAIDLGRSVIMSNIALLQTGRLPLLTPNFPVNDSKFTCCEGMKMLEVDLQELFDTVRVPNGIRTDLIDWMITIKEITDQYSSYGQWISDKINEMKQMSQLCYEYADKAYSMELPSIASITQSVTRALDLSENEDGEFKPKLKECKIPIKQRTVQAEQYHTSHNKLENYKWKDFFCTEYHGICSRLPLMCGPTEFLFQEVKPKKSH